MEIKSNVLVTHDLRPDEYVYMYCLKHPSKHTIRLAIDQSTLIKKGFIELDKHTGKVLLTDKGKIIIEGHTSEYMNKVKAESKDVVNWIEEYRTLFPVKNTAKRLLRGSRISCVKRMQTFIEEHSSSEQIMTKDLIITATSMYLAREVKNSYLYTKSADYFIYKGNKNDSMLLTYLSTVLDEGIEPADIDINTGGLTDDI